MPEWAERQDMEKEITVHVVVEINKTDHRKLDFHQHQVTGRQIKEAAGLPLDTELAVKREGEFDQVTNHETLTIKDGQRFVVIHKEYTIIVNTMPKTWTEHEISYKQVIILAFGSYSEDPRVSYTVEYFRGHKDKHEGSLTKGESVRVKNEMVFNVTKTDQS